MSNEPRFLVVDGYLKKSRDELAAAGAGVGGDLYGAMLKIAVARILLRYHLPL